MPQHLKIVVFVLALILLTIHHVYAQEVFATFEQQLEREFLPGINTEATTPRIKWTKAGQGYVFFLALTLRPFDPW